MTRSRHSRRPAPLRGAPAGPAPEADPILSVLLVDAAGPEEPAASDARCLLLAFRNAGFPARAVALRGRGEELAVEPRSEGGALERGALVQVTRASAPWFFVAEGADRNVGRTHFDTDRLPPLWVARCNRMDEVWVPSSFNVETFARSGVDLDRLRVVPPPLDLTELPRAAPRANRTTLFVASTDGSARCGADLLVDAFAREFRDDPDVRLLLLARGPAAAALSGERRRLARLAIDRDEHSGVRARIRIERGTDPRARRARIAAASAFVQPSRGDGLGRETLEAAAMGVPVVVTRFGSPVDFFHERSAFFLDNAVVPVGEEIVAEDPALRGHRWAEPIGFHLAETLRRIVEDPSSAGAVARRARDEVVASHSIERVARGVRTLLAARVPDARDAEAVPAPVRAEPAFPGVPSVERVVRVAWEGQFPGELGPFGLPLASRIVGQGFRVACTPAEYAALGGPPDVRVVGEGGSAGGSEAGAWVGVAGACSLAELAAADEIWTPWTSVRDRLVASGEPAARVAVPPVPVDERIFGSDVEPALLPTSRRLRLLFLGPADRAGGFDVLVSAYAAAFTDRDDVVLLVAPLEGHGSDGVATRLAALQDTPGAADVLLLDPVQSEPERARLFAASDLLVLPYRDERVSETAIEAMACGRAALVPVDPTFPSTWDALGALTTAAERRASAQVDPLAPAWFLEADAGALARRLRALAADRASLRERGARAREAVRERRGWTAVVEFARARLAALVERAPLGTGLA